MDMLSRTADALAVTPLLNCLLREATDPAEDPETHRVPTEPVPGTTSSPSPAATPRHTVHRLRATGRLLRVRPGHRPSGPELWTGRAWRALDHARLVDLAVQEMCATTGRANPALAAEMAASRAAVRAVLAARARRAPPEDLWLRSEQALVMGHPYHPAPKARTSEGSPTAWLRYAPEAYARFPLVLLGVREDAVVEDGDTRALDALGGAPPGYRLLPAHPWQLDLSDGASRLRSAFAEGRLVRLGTTRAPARPTSSVRTVYIPGDGGHAREDVFLKFSLDVRITNDVRRMRRHELLHVRRTDPLVTAAFAAMGGPAAWLSDRGYRTVDGLFETCAVLVRDGLDRRLVPGATAVLTAALCEGFPGNPLDRLTDPRAWWSAYLRCVVPPVLEAFARFGVAVECHLQNTLVAVDALGTPVQSVFRDAEGAKTVPGTPHEAAWRRLVYCLVVNNLSEVAGALTHRFPGSAAALWALARDEFERSGRLPALPDLAGLLDAPTLPGKANLLSRWIRAEGTAPRYLPVPNPLANGTVGSTRART
ncbi:MULTISPECIES: IucA/IucC family protein [unclassified Streptomyces]|uniref:IucA/IucC family protein n=1 Tax=unclassified Streptomyces TaxID=2593676 RepID=UPI0006F28987|nr:MULTISPECIES: IucA/IucC family protein [unclassified Streptomyces]KQX56124.1 iron transporter [Streptomyces sp. Root1304]KRA96940.1 iron transporter [Streptomyces sp. Root66D1]